MATQVCAGRSDGSRHHGFQIARQCALPKSRVRRVVSQRLHAAATAHADTDNIDRYSIVKVIEPNQEIRERLVVVRDPRGSVAGITNTARKLDGFKYVDDLPHGLASALKDPKRCVSMNPCGLCAHVCVCVCVCVCFGLTCRNC